MKYLVERLTVLVTKEGKQGLRHQAKRVLFRPVVLGFI
jgi:hypothetical protein